MHFLCLAGPGAAQSGSYRFFWLDTAQQSMFQSAKKRRGCPTAGRCCLYRAFYLRGLPVQEVPPHLAVELGAYNARSKQQKISSITI